MKFLKSVLDFYINSSIHVALTAFSFAWITLIQFGIPYDEGSLYFVFFATISGYNFVKYFGLAKFHYRSLTTWLKLIQILSLFATLAMLYYVFQINFEAIILLIILGLITFLYAIPLIPKHIFLDKHRNLREISGLKVYVIAFVWALATVLLPLLNNDVKLDVDVLITCIQRFCLVLVLMLPFEIRDLNYDSLKLSTIPQKIGIKNTKLIGVALLVLFFVLEFFKFEINSQRLVSISIMVILCLIVLLRSKQNQSQYYSGFWVESVPTVWLLILLILI